MALACGAAIAGWLGLTGVLGVAVMLLDMASSL
jgi:hypothetical protein